MSATVERIPLTSTPRSLIGTDIHLQLRKYSPPHLSANHKKVYIQATLHADEIPGLLVNHHLIHMLDKAAANNQIMEEIYLVPYANPIGLNQYYMGTHIGRFSLNTGVNFNRDWPDVTSKVADRVKDKLSTNDREANVKMIRDTMKDIIKAEHSNSIEKNLKLLLFSLACDSDIVLDLHCDSDAVLHMYTHDRLWPDMKDLAAELDSKCHLLASSSGGNPFDETLSCPWADLQDRFPDKSIPMACQSVTVELRGERDVSDEYATKDATAIFRFLQRRGYIAADKIPSLPHVCDASPLNGVDMIEATCPGVIVWKSKLGDHVKEGQVLGEIVDIEDPYAPRTPIVSRTSGLIFGVRNHRIAQPGQIIVKVAGSQSLEWRQGHLLTA